MQQIFIKHLLQLASRYTGKQKSLVWVMYESGYFILCDKQLRILMI